MQVTSKGVATPFLSADNAAVLQSSPPSDVAWSDFGLYTVSQGGSIVFMEPRCGAPGGDGLGAGAKTAIAVAVLFVVGIAGWLALLPSQFASRTAWMRASSARLASLCEGNVTSTVTVTADCNQRRLVSAA